MAQQPEKTLKKNIRALWFQAPTQNSQHPQNHAIPRVFRGQESKCQVDVSQRKNKELAKTNLKNMDRTMQESQHIRSIKHLRPKNSLSTNVNHKGLQRSANEYAEERICSVYKDLISKNNNVDILNSASRILQCWSYYVKINSARHQDIIFISVIFYSPTLQFVSFRASPLQREYKQYK